MSKSGPGNDKILSASSKLKDQRARRLKTVRPPMVES
jgi:hypothetical protein